MFDFGVLIHDTPSRNLCCLFPTWGLADLASPFRGFEKKATIIGSKKVFAAWEELRLLCYPRGVLWTPVSLTALWLPQTRVK